MAASLSWIRSLRPAESPSSAERARSCAWPSPRLTSTVKLVLADQAAARRPVPSAVRKARGSVVLAAQVRVDWPAGVTVA